MMYEKSKEQYAAFIGLDWADKKHDICLKPCGKDKQEYSVLPNRPESIDKWSQELCKRFQGKKLAVCLEQKKGPLIYALLKYDFLVLYPVNPQTLAKYRRAFVTSRAKDDPTDAALMVELLQKHKDKLSSWAPGDPHTRKLQMCVEFRRRLVGDKVKLTNRLTSLLKGYYPQVIEWFADKNTDVFHDFLKTWPTLDKVKRAHPATLKRFFHARNVRRQNVIENRLKSIGEAVPLTRDPSIIESSAAMALVLVVQLKHLRQSIQKFESEIDSLFKKHEDHLLFSTLPGAGDVYAPRLLVAFGRDRKRYKTADDILKYSGIAPVTERSGNKTWVHWRYSCPKFVRQSFVEWAGETVRHSFWAAEYYRQQRLKGKTHQAAVRTLAFKWIRIVFRCWKDRTPYDESKYLMALQKKGSPLIKNFALPN